MHPVIIIIIHPLNVLFPQDQVMNIEEVEESLRLINAQLLTQKEIQFIYNVC